MNSTDAWSSTHQLLPQKYNNDCLKYVKRLVNQSVASPYLMLLLDVQFSSSDDKVEQGWLSNAFDVTCRAWEVFDP